MGASLSFCGLRASPDASMASRSPFATKDGRDLRRSASQRLRAGSSAAASDASSVASILSSSERLIPEAFAPVDIQVLSQRQRQRRPSRSSQNSLAALLSSQRSGDGVPMSQYSHSQRTSAARRATSSDASEENELLMGSVGSGRGSLSARGLVRGCA